VDDHAGLNGGERSAFVLRNAQIGFDNGVGVKRSVDGSEQSRNAFAGEGGDRHSRGAGAMGAIILWTEIHTSEQRRALALRQQINLVQDFNSRLGERIKLAENFLDLRLLLFAIGGGSVADVKKHLGPRNLFKRGAEAGDERVGQIANEADRVRQQNPAAAGQLNCPQFRIEGGKHARR